MNPGWTAFTIRCIAGSSVGAPLGQDKIRLPNNKYKTYSRMA